MSSVQLLDNTRRLNAILHRKNSGKVVFNDICAAMCDILSSNVLVLSKKGKLLGIGKAADMPSPGNLADTKVGDFIDSKLNARLTDVLSTKENVNLQTLGFSEEVSANYEAIATPIDVAGRRYGTLFIYNNINKSYSIDDIIICEYGATVVGLEMMRSVTEESAEENRRIHGVQAAISALSSSELEAVYHVFEELSGCEGVLVASRVADKAGITRSVIVNALRKLESAEVIESRSSGMKGTYIRIVNPLILDEIAELHEDAHGF